MIEEELKEAKNIVKSRFDSGKTVNQIVTKICPDLSDTRFLLGDECVSDEEFDLSFLKTNLTGRELAIKENPGNGKHRPPKQYIQGLEKIKDSKKEETKRDIENKKIKAKAVNIFNEGCELLEMDEGVYELKIGTITSRGGEGQSISLQTHSGKVSECVGNTSRSYILNLRKEPSCSCPNFSKQVKVLHTCKHLVVALTMLGISNEKEEGELLTKIKYSKKEQQKMVNKMKTFDMNQINMDEVNNKYKNSLIPKKSVEKKTEIPYIDLKSCLASFESYYDAKTEINKNDIYKCQWYGVHVPDGRRKCPGQKHEPKERISKGTLALISDFVSFRKNLFAEGFSLYRERRFFLYK